MSATQTRFSHGLRQVALMCFAILICAGVATAQLPMPTSTQFDITGFLQEASLDNSADAHSGGWLKVNGHLIRVPAETIVILPANALSWQELFARAPLPWGLAGAYNNGFAGPTTGMAAADCAVAPLATGCTAPPLTTYEVHVVGNRVLNGPAGADVYIAGLIDISQQGLNSGAGFINFIDYSLGEMWVGGTMGTKTGARVRLNDPIGRYGRSASDDVRFTVDPDNPTIMSGTGYPMCLPRTDPAAADDPLCPQGNRPIAGLDPVTGQTIYISLIRTANLTSTCAGTCVPLPAGTFPDSTRQAPFEVGDYIIFAGTMVKDAPVGGFAAGDGPTVGPMPVSTSTYISAHTITNNVGIYTFPGSNPAYIMTDVTLIGTGGLTVLGAGEAVIRTRFEGMMTDASRTVHLYGIDLNPTTGAPTDRDWGTIGVDPGPLGGAGAVEGRWRFRPPCAVFGTVVAKPDKQCVMNQAGTFLPPTREMRAVIEGLQATQVAAVIAGDTTKTAANGLYWGQYHAPITEYIFPENIPGTPIVENNFQALQFLAYGGYQSSGINLPGASNSSILAGQLNPWPGATAPVIPAACGLATVGSAGGPYTVASSGTVTLLGSAVSGTGPFTYAWTVSAGTLSSATVANPVFTAPVGPATVTATLTVTGNCGPASPVSATITVSGPTTPTANVPAAVAVLSGTKVQFAGVGTDPNIPAQKVSFTWTQLNANTAGIPNVFGNTGILFCGLSNSPVTCNASIQATLPLGSVNPITIQLQGVATNASGVKSPAAFTAVTFAPTADVITVTLADYRTAKQRLILNITSSLPSNTPGMVWTLAPYLTEDGTTFDPATLGNKFAVDALGALSLTLVGAPAPACNLPNPGGLLATPCAQRPLVVKSNIGGQSQPTALQIIRLN